MNLFLCWFNTYLVSFCVGYIFVHPKPDHFIAAPMIVSTFFAAVYFVEAVWPSKVEHKS